ncbi:hypothetical protein OSB04_000809, partial [Centaurea solstitialis]
MTETFQVLLLKFCGIFSSARKRYLLLVYCPLGVLVLRFSLRFFLSSTEYHAVGTATEQHSAPRAASLGRASQPVINHAELRHQSMRSSSSSSYLTSAQSNNTSEQNHPQSNNTAERVQPASARSNRSPLLHHPPEQSSSARAVPASRPTSDYGAPSVPLTLRPSFFGGQADAQSDTQKNKSSILSRLSLDLGAAFAFRDTTNQRSANTPASTSALQDEVWPLSLSTSENTCRRHYECYFYSQIDMLQEENESLLEKLRIAEERCHEAEARTRLLERQVANLGEGVSLEAKFLSRQESNSSNLIAALKEATAQTATLTQNHSIKWGEIEALRVDAEYLCFVIGMELTIESNDVLSLDKMAREEAASCMEHLHVYECEVKSLKTLTQRVVLTHEEMEEVVLKRCWLARYWSLCVQHEIAGARYEYWSSFAPLPVEVVIAAGQKAKEDNLMANNDKEQREKVLKDTNEISGEGSVESMLLVERGLREMTLLKVEDALAFAMALQRWPNALKSVLTDELKLPIKGQHTAEVYELSKQESDDVLFKQAWLMYFWRRVKVHGLEPDIVDDRLQFWMNQGDHPPTSHDAVEVERGLVELRKLGIEAQLWQASRKLIDPDSEHKWKMH